MVSRTSARSPKTWLDQIIDATNAPLLRDNLQKRKCNGELKSDDDTRAWAKELFEGRDSSCDGNESAYKDPGLYLYMRISVSVAFLTPSILFHNTGRERLFFSSTKQTDSNINPHPTHYSTVIK